MGEATRGEPSSNSFHEPEVKAQQVDVEKRKIPTAFGTGVSAYDLATLLHFAVTWSVNDRAGQKCVFTPKTS